MPVFDGKSLLADPDGLSLLAAVLQTTSQARSDASRRGEELANSSVAPDSARIVRAGAQTWRRAAGRPVA